MASILPAGVVCFHHAPPHYQPPRGHVGRLELQHVAVQLAHAILNVQKKDVSRVVLNSRLVFIGGIWVKGGYSYSKSAGRTTPYSELRSKLASATARVAIDVWQSVSTDS